MPETYVITGGAGFIGSHIASRLLEMGHIVRIVDNFSTSRPETVDRLRGKPNLTIVEDSITNLSALHECFDGVDYVFHQAALPSVPRSVEDPLGTHEHCVTGTLNVLIAARDAGVKRVVYAASSSAYGDNEEEFKVETLPPNPISPYGAAKLFGEYYARVFYEVYGLETVSLRYFNVFGPWQDPASEYAAVIPIFINRMLRGEPPIVHGDGLQSRDFTYIDNVVHGNLLAAKAEKAPGQVINIATADRITLLSLVDRLNTLLGTNVQPVHTDPRPGDIKHSRADIQLAGELLGYEPIVDFDTGLARTLEWYRGQ
jgi:nucleoside-diphosphate-sugar epimerase